MTGWEELVLIPRSEWVGMAPPIPAQGWARCLKQGLSQGWLGGAPEGPSLC